MQHGEYDFAVNYGGGLKFLKLLGPEIAESFAPSRAMRVIDSQKCDAKRAVHGRGRGAPIRNLRNLTRVLWFCRPM